MSEMTKFNLNAWEEAVAFTSDIIISRNDF